MIRKTAVSSKMKERNSCKACLCTLLMFNPFKGCKKLARETKTDEVDHTSKTSVKDRLVSSLNELNVVA